MGSRDRLRSANSVAYNSVEQTLERFESNVSECAESPIPVQTQSVNNITPEVKIPVYTTTGGQAQTESNMGPKGNFDNTNGTVKQKLRPGAKPKWNNPAKIVVTTSAEKRRKIDAYSVFYNGSLTNYINALIDKDLAENGDAYEKRLELLKQFSVN